MTEVSEDFRLEIRGWLETNCPESMRTPMPQDEMPSGGKKTHYKNPDTKRWMDLCAERGLTAPTWPVQYGGAGMDSAQHQVLRQEMAR
ncbi:MAG TPA: acyl-CoA dehydrogenase, partial [Gammaproteobacteria bacterium]|nr:acyl-CoA dehydrogenase [Gammaproteobacteria bacterium]